MIKVEEIKARAVPILKAAGANKAALFGSYARGDQTSESDIDILADLPHSMSLFDVVGIKLDLEDVLGKKVDLVQYDAIKPRLRPYIMQDLIQMI